MTRRKIDQPEKHWDKLWAPGGHVAMITSVDKAGRVNAASYATAVRIVHNPVQIAFTTYATGQTGQNIEATGEFVVNLPSYDRAILEKVRIVGLPFAPGVSELEKAGLTALPSKLVRPPRIEECTRHFECRLVWFKDWLGRRMIVGDVVAASVDEGGVDANGFIVWDRIKPVAFCGAPYEDKFVAQYEVMQVGMPYDGPEAQRGAQSTRDLFKDENKLKD